MQTIFSELMGVPLLALVYAKVLLDVAPQPAVLAGLALGMIAVLCGVVLVIAIIAFFVIRAIKKNREGGKQSRAD